MTQGCRWRPPLENTPSIQFHLAQSAVPWNFFCRLRRRIERRVHENGCHAIFAIRQRADEDFIGLAVDCAFLGFAIFD
jgi:hypothetical protein|tara:strand:- start:293 stop:526 length:234 start_codon:yes stop_codon:yes gene_type:complete